ncbi:MAG: hypothetical protein WC139_12910 [Candidatus Kapaibacterium sp.]
MFRKVPIPLLVILCACSSISYSQNTTISLGGGYVGSMVNNTRDIGFNIQADAYYPLTKLFGISVGANYVQYHDYTYEFTLYNLNWTTYNAYSNPVSRNQVTLFAGISLGNMDSDELLNYSFTAGAGAGIFSQGQIYYPDYRNIYNGNYYYSIETVPAMNLKLSGIYLSGRASVKLYNEMRIYIEPSLNTWNERRRTNYVINSGVSLSL